MGSYERFFSRILKPISSCAGDFVAGGAGLITYKSNETKKFIIHKKTIIYTAPPAAKSPARDDIGFRIIEKNARVREYSEVWPSTVRLVLSKV